MFEYGMRDFWNSKAVVGKNEPLGSYAALVLRSRSCSFKAVFLFSWSCGYLNIALCSKSCSPSSAKDHCVTNWRDQIFCWPLLCFSEAFLLGQCIPCAYEKERQKVSCVLGNKMYLDEQLQRIRSVYWFVRHCTFKSLMEKPHDKCWNHSNLIIVLKFVY